MKKYQSPDIKEVFFHSEDVIATSGIISSEDSQGVAETQESSWNDSWN